MSPRPRRPALPVALVLLLGLALPVAVQAQAAKADPLPSWNDGPVKHAILGFVARVTAEGSPDFLPEPERIAVFDNDGTLWQEKPVVQGAFLVERVKALAAKDPSLRQRQPYKAVLEGDVDALMEGGEKALMELFAATHANMTQEQFQADVSQFLKTARHPKLGVPYTQLTYRSGGDIAMLGASAQRRGPSFQLLINHDDADREFAYQEKDGASLRAAKEGGWNVVSMRDDWKRVFSGAP